MKIKISIPNDYNSEEDIKVAIAECYSGDEWGAENDNCQQLFEVLAAAAKGAGLTFVRETDFGAEWQGTEKQCADARNKLPTWANVGE